MHRLVAPACFAILGACVPDLRIGQDALLTCAQNTDCVSEWHCVETIGRCVPDTPSDVEAPTLLTSVVTPQRVGRGGTVQVSFTVDELLAIDPVAQVAGTGHALTLTADGPNYTAQMAATGSEPEGAATIEVMLFDRLGNSATRTAGTFIYDFTEPTVSSAQAKDAQTLSLRFSEPMRLDDLVDATNYTTTQELAILAVAVDADGQGVQLLSAAQPPGVALTLAVSGVFDVAGNALAASVLELTTFGAAPDPAAPTPIAPATDARVLALHTVLVWTSPSGASRYTVDVARVVPGDADDDYTTHAVAGSPFSTQDSNLPLTLPSAETFRWRVRADTTAPGAYGASQFDAMDDRVYVYCESDPCTDSGRVGNRSKPYRSLKRALSDALVLGNTQVLVAARPAGAGYHEALFLSAGVSLLGGYTPDFVDADPVAQPTVIDGASELATIRAYSLTAVAPVLLDGFTVRGAAGAEARIVDIYNSDASLTVSRVVIDGGSRALASTALMLEGAGSVASPGPLFDRVTVLAPSSLGFHNVRAMVTINSYARFIDSTFVGGSSTFATSTTVYNQGGGSDFLRCSFLPGTTSVNGPNFYTVENNQSDARFHACTFTGGAQTKAFGLTYTVTNRGGSLLFEDSTITGGSAAGGETIALYNAADPQLTVRGTTVVGGEASGTASSTAVRNFTLSGDSRFIDSTFRGGNVLGSGESFGGSGTWRGMTFPGPVTVNVEVTGCHFSGGQTQSGLSVAFSSSGSVLLTDTWLEGGASVSGSSQGFTFDGAGAFKLQMNGGKIESGSAQSGLAVPLLITEGSAELSGTQIVGSNDSNHYAAVCNSSCTGLTFLGVQVTGRLTSSGVVTVRDARFTTAANNAAIETTDMDGILVVERTQFDAIAAINSASATARVVNNVFVVSAPTSFTIPMVVLHGANGVVANNTFVSPTVSALELETVGVPSEGLLVLNNLFVCVDATALRGIRIAQTAALSTFAGNAFFDCTTAVSRGANDYTSVTDVNDASLMTLGIAGTASANLGIDSLANVHFADFAGGDLRLTSASPEALLHGGIDTTASVCGPALDAPCGNVSDDFAGAPRTCTAPSSCVSRGAFEFTSE